MMKRLLYVMVLPLLFMMTKASAQDRLVTGRVTDSSGAPVVNASVIVKGGRTGTQTASDGSFSIRVPATARTLVVSSVGFGTREVPVGSGSISVTLQSTNAALSEVVVIGYGTTRRRDLTGSVATVSSKDFQKGQITTPEQLIAGKVPGVSVISNSGAPGSGSTIRIRGGASINGSNDPLIVLDGVPLSNNSIAGASNPLDLINPNDIESFSILKDASAAAIYGNRASNGVIIITTKKGQRGKPVINFTTQFSVSKLPKEAPVLSPSQFRAYVNSHDTSSTGIYKSLLGSANTDWQKEIYQTALSTDNNLSISGSAGKLPYRASVGFTDQNGILKTTSLKRYTADISLSPTLFDNHLKINFNAKGTQVNQRFANEGGVIGDAVNFNPTVPVYSGKNIYGGYFEYTDPNNTPTGLKSLAPLNPVGMLYQNNNVSTVYRGIASLALDYKVHFLPDLHLNVNLGYDGSRGTGSQTIPADAASNLDSYKDSTGKYYSGYYHQYKQVNENKLFEGFLSYTKEIKSINSHIDAVAGYSIQDFKTTGYNFPSYFTGGMQNPNSIPTYLSDINEYELTSVYGRLNYEFNNKYIITGTIRNDYSTKFAPNLRSGVFPSAAFAWKIKDEGFLKNNKAISTLKLRLGYGVTGNQEGIGSYDYLSDYSQGTSTARYQLGTTFYPVYRPGAYYPGRTWETTATSNVGLDYGFANDRISGTIDYYHRDTKHLLATISQPAGTNFGNQIVGNIGNMRDQGVEFSINGQIIKERDVNWTAGFNITYNKNTITNLTALANTSSSGLLTGNISGGTGNTIQINSVGSPKYSFYTYQQVYASNGQPIDGLFVDRNKDGVINQSDLYIGKSPDPQEYLGFSTDASIKRWSAGLVARASFGNYVYNNVASTTGVQRNILNPIGTIGNGSSSILESGLIGSSDKDVLSDYWIQNGSFLRMDNIHIGYDFGRVFRNAATLRVSATVQNVFIITKYNGVDPERSSGIDNNVYPRPRTYVLGLNLTL